MDAEISLENWCEKNKIDPEKVFTDVWDNTIKEIERGMDDCLDHHGNDIMFDAVYIIEQELSENPHWKINKDDTVEGEDKHGTK